jgi:predicted transcriptional regulator
MQKNSTAIKTKITEFLKKQIEEGATLVYEDPAEHYGSTMISNLLIRNPKITNSEIRVYLLLKSFAYGEKIHCFPGQETLAQWLEVDRTTINRILKSLRKKGLLDWIQVGLNSTNVYVIKKIPEQYIHDYQKKEQEIEARKASTPTPPDVAKMSHPEKSTDVAKIPHPEKSTDVAKIPHPDVAKMSHKENKKEEYVVVVDEGNHPPGESAEPEKQTTDQPSGQAVATTSNKPETDEESAKTTRLRTAFKDATGNDLPYDVAGQVIKQWPASYIKEKIEVCRRSRITESVVGFFIRALEEDYPLPEPKNNQRVKTGRTPKPKRTDDPNREKKKALIRSLYIN